MEIHYSGMEIVKTSDFVLIVSHLSPDGDAIGSMIGLGLALKGLGKDVSVVTEQPLPLLYSFLPGSELVIPPCNLKRKHFECGMVLDCTGADRLGTEIKMALNNCKTVINIDHHVSNTYFGAVNIVDLEAAATGEIIYKILSGLNIRISPEIATNLYAALVADTGSFQYQNTTPGCHLTASSLLACGADRDRVQQYLNEQRTLSSLRLLEKSLSTLALDEDGSIAWMVIPQRFFLETGSKIEASDDFVNYPKSIAGVEVGILFKEINDRQIRIGFRSKNFLDVNILAGLFGGGGHERASGCTVTGTLKEVEALVISATKEYFNKKRCGVLL